MLFIINHENMIGFKIRVFPDYAFRVCCYAPATGTQTYSKLTVRLDSTNEFTIFCSLWFGVSDCCARSSFFVIDNLVQVDC